MVDDYGLKNLPDFFSTNWYQRRGLISAIIVSIIIAESLLVAADAKWWVHLIIVTLIPISITIIWWLSKLPPKARRDSVGFIVSIACEDDEESKRLHADFIIPLQKLIRSGVAGSSFHFLEMPQHIASTIIDHEDAVRARIRSRAHFILYGQIRRRSINGVDHHVIDLNGLVTHNPIPIHISQRFSQEFKELLPRRLEIPTENDLFAFEFTSEWAEIVAKYIIGIAAGMSGDIDYAEQLFTDIQQKLANKDKGFPIYSRLASRLPKRIAELHEIRAAVSYDSWKIDHNNIHIKELGMHLANAAKGDHIVKADTYRLMAIHDFLLNRDIDSSFENLKKIKDTSAVWNFNMAFLYVYQGNLKKASQHYREAALHQSEPDLLSQIEDFMCWVLTEEPEKYQFYFSLGFFNRYVKGDELSARKDFDNFLNFGSSDEYIKERSLAEEWIKEIDKKISVHESS